MPRLVLHLGRKMRLQSITFVQQRLENRARVARHFDHDHWIKEVQHTSEDMSVCTRVPLTYI